MKSLVTCCALAGFAVLALAPVPASGQGTDELWQVTTKIDMPGLPMAMPEQTQTVCVPKGKPVHEEAVSQDKNCRMTDVRQSGNRTTFTIVCEGKDRLTGTGEIVASPDSYNGTMTMQGTMDGRPMNMTQTFSGRRTGTCTSEDPKKKHEAMVAQNCEQAVEQLNTPMFTMEQSPCQAQKPAFCRRVAALAQDMRDPQVYRATAQRRSDWPAMLQACNQDASAVTLAACQRSIGAKDYAFVGDFCEADAKALAAQHCTGRDYTAAMASEYAPLCRRYAARPAPAPGPTPAARPAPPLPPVAAPQAPSAPAQQPGATDAAKEGVKEGLREGATDAIRRLFRW